ncbi:hypothetical protein BC829DRAFT_419154 [Chytridium lagenaria]|nr:hypothetical protein BC829DRAFT_419154 [Chytridium lagenaria]
MSDRHSDDNRPTSSESTVPDTSVRTPPVSPHVTFAERDYGKSVKCALFVNDTVQNTNILILASLSTMNKLWYPGEDNVEDFQRSILLLLDDGLNKIIDPNFAPVRILRTSVTGHVDFPLMLTSKQTAIWDHWVTTWGPQRISLNSILNCWKSIPSIDTGKRKTSHTDSKTHKKIRTTSSPGLSNAAVFYLRILDSLLFTAAKTVLKVSSIFATSMSPEVENLPATVANHFSYTITNPTKAFRPREQARWTDFDKVLCEILYSRGVTVT